jgi:hypothetical protein
VREAHPTTEATAPHVSPYEPSFFLLGDVPARLLIAAVLAILMPGGEQAKG